VVLVVLPLSHAAGMEIDSVTEAEDVSLMPTTKALRLRNMPRLVPVLRKESLLKEKGDHSKAVAAGAADVAEEGAARPKEQPMSHCKEKPSRKDSSRANSRAAVVGWEDPGVADVDVNFVFTPPWSTEMIADEAKEELRAMGFAV